MLEYEITTHGDLCRVRWVYDEYYTSDGSFAYDTEEETAQAVTEEQEMLESGEFVALGAIVETRPTPKHMWIESDSLWGVVIEPDTTALVEFARHSLDLEAQNESGTIERARSQFENEGTLEIDDTPAVSRADGNESRGAYVAAWVWVADEVCNRCDSVVHSEHGCAECQICDEGGSDLLEEISEHAQREHGREFSKLDTAQQWALIEDHA